MRGIKILAIGDVHCAVGYDNKRMQVAGEFAASFRPDVIVFIGDLADMPSLNLHRSKIDMEGERYIDDCVGPRSLVSECRYSSPRSTTGLATHTSPPTAR